MIGAETLRRCKKGATAGTTEILQMTDYYPYGYTIVTAGANGYRYGYQGQYAEKDGATGWNEFDLRMYDSRIGRWLSVDPKGEFYSPYVGMGNEPVSTTDPDGGRTSPIFDSKSGKFLGTDSEGFKGKILFMTEAEYNKALKEIGVSMKSGTVAISHQLLMKNENKYGVLSMTSMYSDQKFRAIYNAIDYVAQYNFINDIKSQIPTASLGRLETGHIVGYYEEDGVGKYFNRTMLNEGFSSKQALSTLAKTTNLINKGGEITNSSVTYNLTLANIYLTTVENVQAVFWHEFGGHVLKKIPQSLPGHIEAYKLETLYPGFNRTTQSYRSNILRVISTGRID
jgi:RHS repeat-associated protein